MFVNWEVAEVFIATAFICLFLVGNKGAVTYLSNENEDE